MQDEGINIVTYKNMHQRFTVIDYSIVWYGSINFLSSNKKEANVMRIKNRDLAVEISSVIS